MCISSIKMCCSPRGEGCSVISMTVMIFLDCSGILINGGPHLTVYFHAICIILIKHSRIKVDWMV